MRTNYLPVPTGGWNAAQSFELMPANDAQTLINFIPKETHIEIRKGSTELTTSALATKVETLANHRAADGTETLVAAANGNIYTVNTSTGATTSKGSGYSNNRWQTVNFNDYLLFVNGEDAPLQFDGTTLGAFTAPVTGATPTDLVGVVVFKGRCIYWENNAAKFWYAGAGAYGGALTSFPLDLVTKRGGYVVECCTWSRDSGEGQDDLFVVLMSTGETLVYEGSDPGTAYDFQLIGSFSLGRPLAVRGSVQLGGDRIILTHDGFVNLSTALQVGRMTDKGNLSSKIVNAVKQATNRWGANYGWEAVYHDTESMLVVNIPRYVDATTPANSYSEQYCMNTNTGAWCRFREWDAITFIEHNGNLYMGCYDGHIRQVFTGANDDGNKIKGVCIPAFSMMGMPGHKKQMTMCTITTNHASKDAIGVAALADFELRAFGAATPFNTSGSAGGWDVADWDSEFWDDETLSEPVNYNYPVGNFGYSLSVKINMLASAESPKIYSIRTKFKTGRSI